MAAVITADRADTLDLLQRDARILQNALQDAGLQADGNSLSFELKGQDRREGLRITPDLECTRYRHGRTGLEIRKPFCPQVAA